MSENDSRPQGMNGAPALHPNYKPAEEDSLLQVRFMGNTARVIDVNFKNIDPFQLFAAARWLERHGEKTLALAEQEEAQRLEREAALNNVSAKKSGILLPGQLRKR